MTSFQDSLKTGQRGKIRFRFIKQPEYIKVGARILFRERRTKGIGEVTQVFYFQKGLSVISDYNCV